MIPERRWLNVQMACDYLCLKRGTLYNLVSKGAVPHTKPKGVGLRFDRYKLDEWLEEAGFATVEDQLN